MRAYHFGLLALALPLVMGASECSNMNEADRQQMEMTDQLTAEAQAQVGMPDIINFAERRWAKQIFELRDNPDLSTFTYIVDLEGRLHCLGHSVGYGLPYTVQFTNPMRLANPRYSQSSALPQPDPNGLFMPDSLSATWVLIVDPASGDVQPTYVEPQIIVSRIEMPAVTACPEMRMATR